VSKQRFPIISTKGDLHFQGFIIDDWELINGIVADMICLEMM